MTSADLAASATPELVRNQKLPSPHLQGFRCTLKYKERCFEAFRPQESWDSVQAWVNSISQIRVHQNSRAQADFAFSSFFPAFLERLLQLPGHRGWGRATPCSGPGCAPHTALSSHTWLPVCGLSIRPITPVTRNRLCLQLPLTPPTLSPVDLATKTSLTRQASSVTLALVLCCPASLGTIPTHIS